MTTPSPLPQPLARCSGFFTFAAFAADDDHAAGWRVGQVEGMSRDDAHQLSNQVPSYLAGEAPVPRYAGEQELRQLIHRGVWRVSPLNRDQRLFIHSTPAGTDASGRPSNVFTTVYVFDTDSELGFHPVQLLGSPSLLVPFNKEVNHRRVESRELEANVTMTPRAALEHLMAVHRCSLDHVRAVAATALDAVYTGTPRVVLADDPKNAWAWLTLITFAVDSVSARDIEFSTYERGHTIKGEETPHYGIRFVPPEDARRIAEDVSDLDVIDVRSGVERGSLSTGRHTVVEDTGREIPVTLLSELFIAVVTSPKAAESLLAEPEVTGEKLQKLSQLAAVEPAPAPAPAPVVGVNPFGTAPAVETTPPRQPATVTTVTPADITAIGSFLDRYRSWFVHSGETPYRGWPDLIELLLATSAPGDELWRLQARVFAAAGVYLVQKPDGWTEVNWLPWWKLEDDPELRAEVHRGVRREVAVVASDRLRSNVSSIRSFPVKAPLRQTLDIASAELADSAPQPPQYR